MLHYYQSEKYADAIKAWKKAADLKDDNSNLHYNIALAYSQLEDYREATWALQESLRLMPDNESARTLLQRIQALPDSVN